MILKNDIKFKIIKDFSVSDGDKQKQKQKIEIENKGSKNLLITSYYRTPSGAIKGLNSYLENVSKKTNTENKLFFVVGDFNLNCLDYNESLETRTFYNRIFAYGCIPLLITRPTRVTSSTVPSIDNLFKNTSLKLKKGLVKM